MNNRQPVIVFVAILVIASACSTEKLMIKHKKERFKLPVPNSIDTKVLIDDHGFIEKRAIYKNGEVVYMTDDISTGSNLEYKTSKYGEDILLEIAVKDSLQLDGNNNGKVWKELKSQNIIIGYYNVQIEQRDLFDQILKKLKVKN